MKNYMFKSANLIIIILFFCLEIFAQDSDSLKSTIDFHDKKNLEIQLYFINGFSVSLAKNWNGNDFFRLNVDISGYFENSESERDRIENTQGEVSTSELDRNSDSDEQEINLSIEYLHPFYSTTTLNLYTGVGPIFGYDRYNSNDKEHSNGYSHKYTYSSDRNSYSLGIIGILGFKANIVKSISILGEYRLNFSHYWTESKWKDISDSNYLKYNTTSKTLDLRLSKIILGISLKL